MFIRRLPSGFKYGLIRPAAESYSAGGGETVAESGLAVALFRNSAESTVEIINSVGSRLEVSLTTATPSKRALGDQVAEFAGAACGDVGGESRGQASVYLSRLLTDCLRASHGALLAVAPFNKAFPLSGFSDGVFLPEPLPLIQTMLSAVKEQTAARS
jgi:hypothetical protein